MQRETAEVASLEVGKQQAEEDNMQKRRGLGGGVGGLHQSSSLPMTEQDILNRNRKQPYMLLY